MSSDMGIVLPKHVKKAMVLDKTYEGSVNFLSCCKGYFVLVNAKFLKHICMQSCILVSFTIQPFSTNILSIPFLFIITEKIMLGCTQTYFLFLLC